MDNSDKIMIGFGCILFGLALMLGIIGGAWATDGLANLLMGENYCLEEQKVDETKYQLGIEEAMRQVTEPETQGQVII